MAFEMTLRRKNVARLIAEGDLTHLEIMEKAGVCNSRFYDWRSRPEFQRAVAEYQREIETETLAFGISQKALRLKALYQRWRKLRAVVDRQFAADCVDAVLLRELRSMEQQAAIETGQWTEKRDLTSGGSPIKALIGIDIEEV
jgi:hypothetical protein